jgi:hypothetical protein
MAYSRGRVLAGHTTLFLRRVRVRDRLIVIALFMRGDGLKMMVGGSDMARGSKVVLVTCHLDLGIGHGGSFEWMVGWTRRRHQRLESEVAFLSMLTKRVWNWMPVLSVR